MCVRSFLMRLDSFNNVSGVKNVAKKIASVNRVNEFSKPAPRSVRDEVIARRKNQKDKGIIDIIKNNLENKINEKIKDYLGIRFDFS